MRLHVGITGVRHGETIVGFHSAQVEKSQLKVYGRVSMGELVVFPAERYVREYEQNGGDYSDFGHIAFFKDMTPGDIKGYIHDHQISEDTHLHEIPGLEVVVDKLEGDKMKEIPQEDLDLFYGAPKISLMNIYHAIPKKLSSKARRHTLIFRPDIWRVTEESQDEEPWIIYDLHSMKVVETILENRNVYRVRLRQEEERRHAPSVLVVLSKDIVGDTLPVDHKLDNLRKRIHHLTPAALKSGMQKSIRTACDVVRFHNSPLDVSGDDFLRACFFELYQHPGSFVPDLQTFVTGKESALKRLAVSLCEDSYIEDYRIITSLFVSALVVKKHTHWNPPSRMIMKWLDAAVTARSDRRLFDYTTKSLHRPTEMNHLLAYLALEEIRSFKGDINLVSSIKKNPRPVEFTPFSVMPIYHLVDHHTYTEIAYLLPSSPPVRDNYKREYDSIWKLVVGTNPRRAESIDHTSDRVKDIQHAQQQIWDMHDPLTSVQEYTLLEDRTYVHQFTLPDGLLAGMIGTIEIKHKGTTYLATLSVHDIDDAVVMIRPSRDTTTTIIEDDIKREVKAKFWETLQKGVPLIAPKSLPWLKGSRVIYDNDEHHIQFPLGKKKIVPWSSAKQKRQKFPCIDWTGNGNGNGDGDRSMTSHLWNPIHATIPNAMKIISCVIDKLSVPLCQRLMVYMSTISDRIEMYKISRDDGTGQELPLSTLDTKVYQFLDVVAALCPGVLTRSKTSPTKAFDIKYGPVMWDIRNSLLAKLSHGAHDDDEWKNRLGPEDTKRTLYDYQRQSVERMIRTQKKGSLLHAPTGIGKTLITLTYLRHLMTHGGMPKYCVYTLPPSAMATIEEELVMMGLPYRILSLLKKDVQRMKGNYVRPYEITLVKHDHLRSHDFPSYLLSIANDLFFVVDEFHKGMGNTQRTGVMMDVVKLCRKFVGMSATVIRSQDLAPVMAWLGQIVDFEVTEKNFWVAANAMISWTMKVPVVVHRHEVSATFTPSEKQHYHTLTQDMDNYAFRQALDMCYTATHRRMIKLIASLTNTARGIFVIVRNHQSALEFRTNLVEQGLYSQDEIHIITSKSPVNLKPNTKTPIKLLITTPHTSEGYNATLMDHVVECVYLSNQAVRDQLDGRTIRLGQDHNVNIYTVYIGVLQQIWEKYKSVGVMSRALKSIAEDIGIPMTEFM